jgi:insulin gene enhancer protein ISL-1
MSGIPLVARGPEAMRGGLFHPPPGGHPLETEIHKYEPPWKALCDFAQHSDLDKLNMTNSPQFNQLVGQVRR